MVAEPEPLPPAQLKAMRSVLLERLELAEATQEEVDQRVAAAQARGENAAVQVCVRA